jgi:hypothetical protein
MKPAHAESAETFAGEPTADRAADRVAGIAEARTAAELQGIRAHVPAVPDGPAAGGPRAAEADPGLLVDPPPGGLAPVDPVQAVRGAAGIVRSVESAPSATTGAVGRQRAFDLLN